MDNSLDQIKGKEKPEVSEGLRTKIARFLTLHRSEGAEKAQISIETRKKLTGMEHAQGKTNPVKAYPAGAIIFREGEDSPAMYDIHWGRIGIITGNNCAVPAHRKDRMLQRTLENLEETRELFPGTELLVENTGIAADGNRMLDQEEFTALCRERDFRVLIDVGHANANGWDIPKMIRELKDSVRGYHLHNNDGLHDLHNRLRNGTIRFDELIPFICETTPGASGIIEYSRPSMHGETLTEDIRYLRRLTGQN